jgi:hypothetical protein
VTGPSAAEEPLLHAARWCTRLATVLADVGRRTGELADLVDRDWPDAHGREWAERAASLRSALRREADAAAELGGAYDRAATEAPGPAGLPPLPGLTAAGPGRRTGMRLGETDAQRVADERGMRIAGLDPSPPG